MESNKVAHLVYVPFSGLGLYGGHRGKRWLKNRITIFKQFVIPSLQAQTNQDFIVWVSWRHADRGDKDILELESHLKEIFKKVVFTYSGICFWDDKYEDAVAHERLLNAVHGSMGPLMNVMGEADTILMTIQPSDDCYNSRAFSEHRTKLLNSDLQVYGYKHGYVMDYQNQRLCEWNPKTTPPFYTIKFERDTFTDPNLHVKYIGPYKSHEYVKDFLKAEYTDHRGFIVGTHGENISTIFKHPYAGHEFLGNKITDILARFGLGNVQPLKLKTSIRKKIMARLPHNWQRKLRYVLGERFFARIYNWIRS